MYKVEDFVIAIYCLIEDELYPAFCQQHGLPRRAGFPPALSDIECLTVEWVEPQYLGYTTQKQLYEQMHDRWNTWFPALRDRVAFGRQCANLWQVKAWMHHHIVERLGGYQAPCQIIDTLPGKALPTLLKVKSSVQLAGRRPRRQRRCQSRQELISRVPTIRGGRLRPHFLLAPVDPRVDFSALPTARSLGLWDA